MADVLIVGDGPGGLSAALLLAKNGVSVQVFGANQTWMHKAMLYNYLGVPSLAGSHFQSIARQQVLDHGAAIIDTTVTSVAANDGGFFVEYDEGQVARGEFLILAIGSKRELAEGAGVDFEADGTVRVDRDGRTSVPGCYAVGWTARRHKTQAIIAAGEGAAVALDILSHLKGEPFHDFDKVED